MTATITLDPLATNPNGHYINIAENELVSGNNIIKLGNPDIFSIIKTGLETQLSASLAASFEQIFGSLQMDITTEGLGFAHTYNGTYFEGRGVTAPQQLANLVYAVLSDQGIVVDFDPNIAITAEEYDQFIRSQAADLVEELESNVRKAEKKEAAAKKKLKEIKRPKIYSKFMLRPFRYFNMAIVGCGGTGGHLVPLIARYIANLVGISVNLLLIDGDIVEERNCIRQQFIHQDVDKNKAEVLAERYSAAFDTPIQFIPEFLTEKNIKDVLRSLTTSDEGDNCGGILITCTDKNAARKLIHDTLLTEGDKTPRVKDILWIDAGNETDFGQVGFGYYNPSLTPPGDYGDLFEDGKIKTRHEEKFRRAMSGLNMIPTQTVPGLTNTTKDKVEVSCAEQAVADPQNLGINVLAATSIYEVLEKVLAPNLGSRSVDFYVKWFYKGRGATFDRLEDPNQEMMR